MNSLNPSAVSRNPGEFGFRKSHFPGGQVASLTMVSLLMFVGTCSWEALGHPVSLLLAGARLEWNPLKNERQGGNGDRRGGARAGGGAARRSPGRSAWRRGPQLWLYRPLNTVNLHVFKWNEHLTRVSKGRMMIFKGRSHSLKSAFSNTWDSGKIKSSAWKYKTLPCF